VVDDQPAILERVKAGLAGTPWTMHGVKDASEALDSCDQILPHIILISLSLPGDSAFTLFQRVRADLRTKGTPILALTVKTTAEEQARAMEFGFSGIITKPIDSGDLQLKITRALSLDTSHKYFQHRDSLLVLLLPANFNQLAADDISARLRQKVREAVNAGLDGLVIDLSQLKAADMTLIKLGLKVTQLCVELQLPYALAGSGALCLECKNYQETKDWRFSSSFEQAAAALKGTTPE
jgi:two-component system, cell cycle response regulator